MHIIDKVMTPLGPRVRKNGLSDPGDRVIIVVIYFAIPEYDSKLRRETERFCEQYTTYRIANKRERKRRIMWFETWCTLELR